MTGKRAKLVDQTPFWASGAAKPSENTAQLGCGLRGPRRLLQFRLFQSPSGECRLNIGNHSALLMSKQFLPGP
jgi:hypothetical protein